MRSAVSRIRSAVPRMRSAAYYLVLFTSFGCGWKSASRFLLITKLAFLSLVLICRRCFCDAIVLDHWWVKSFVHLKSVSPLVITNNGPKVYRWPSATYESQAFEKRAWRRNFLTRECDFWHYQSQFTGVNGYPPLLLDLSCWLDSSI